MRSVELSIQRLVFFSLILFVVAIAASQAELFVSKKALPVARRTPAAEAKGLYCGANSYPLMIIGQVNYGSEMSNSRAAEDAVDAGIICLSYDEFENVVMTSKKYARSTEAENIRHFFRYGHTLKKGPYRAVEMRCVSNCGFTPAPKTIEFRTLYNLLGQKKTTRLSLEYDADLKKWAVRHQGQKVSAITLIATSTGIRKIRISYCESSSDSACFNRDQYAVGSEKTMNYEQ